MTLAQPWPPARWQNDAAQLSWQKNYIVYHWGLLLRQIETELFFYNTLHNVNVPNFCISKLWKKDIYNGMCSRRHIRKSLSYRDDFFFLSFFATSVCISCPDIVTSWEDSSSLIVWAFIVAAFQQASNFAVRIPVKRVFNMSLRRISVTDLLTLILLPSAENCFPVVIL